MDGLEVTSGQLARALGLSERHVAAQKAAGRIPAAPSGRIRLPELVAMLWRENVDYRSRLAALGQRRHETTQEGPDPAEAFDAGLRLAASVGARLALARALGTPIGEDPGGIAREAVGEACTWFGITPAPP